MTRRVCLGTNNNRQAKILSEALAKVSRDSQGLRDSRISSDKEVNKEPRLVTFLKNSKSSLEVKVGEEDNNKQHLRRAKILY